MAGPEDSGTGRTAAGRGRVVGHQRHRPAAEDAELAGVLFSALPAEIGDDGLPTGVELEQRAEDAAEGRPLNGDGISAPFRPEDIRIETQTTTVDLLLSRLREDMIDLAPDFQRRTGIWSDAQQSRLIESLLLRIPISSFHMAQDEDDTWSVVDGIQRLTAIARFMNSTTVSMPPLKLRGLDYMTAYIGKGYADLPGRLKIRLRETQLVVHIIQQGTPEEVKFDVFRRINTGGMPLKPQEIRHALVGGPVRGYLADLAEDPEFREATGHSISNERMADREMVLRFLAFRRADVSTYCTHDLDRFLIAAMHGLNALSTEHREVLASEFRGTMRCATGLFGGHAFRKWQGQKAKSPINKALFEALAVSLADLGESARERLVTSRQDVQREFFKLMKDPDFDRAISGATGDPKRVRTRFAKAAELFRGVACR